MVLSDQRGSRTVPAISGTDEPKVASLAAQSVPLFQLVARGDPTGGHVEHGVSAVAAERRGPAVRTRDRLLS